MKQTQFEGMCPQCNSTRFFDREMPRYYHDMQCMECGNAVNKRECEMRFEEYQNFPEGFN